MDLRKLRCDSVDWIHAARDNTKWQPSVKMAAKLRISLADNFLTKLFTVGFSVTTLLRGGTPLIYIHLCNATQPTG
jgi:hypothetical protein